MIPEKIAIVAETLQSEFAGLNREEAIAIAWKIHTNLIAKNYLVEQVRQFQEG